MTEPLVIRRHQAAGVSSEAVFSACGACRYALTRQWDPDLPRLAWVMLTPSTADERQSDQHTGEGWESGNGGTHGPMPDPEINSCPHPAPCAARRRTATGAHADATRERVRAGQGRGNHPRRALTV